MRVIIVLLCLTALVGAAGIGYVGGAKHAWKSRTSQSVLATVNGENVTSSELDGALKLKGGQVMQVLIECKAILQEGQKQGLSVSDAEVTLPDGIGNDQAVRQANDLQIRSKLMLKKLLLKDVTDATKHQVYELFKDELAQFEISYIAVASQTEVDAVEATLNGQGGFQKAAESFSTNESLKKSGGKVGFLTLPQIDRQFGYAVEDAVVQMKPGSTSGPIKTARGFFFIKLGAVHRTYEELKSNIEDLIATAGQVEMLQQIMFNTHIVASGHDVVGSPAPK